MLQSCRITRLLILGWVSLLICSSGCGWVRSEASPQRDVFIEKPLTRSRFVKAGRIINPARLKEGGRLLIRPFSPGANVEMTEEIDMISLRIIRGILDVYEGVWPKEDRSTLVTENFDVGVLEQPEEAELVLSGRITQIGFTPAWKKWMFMTPKIFLAVEGRVVETKNGTTVLMFSDHIEKKLEGHTHRRLGLEIGRRIGQFIFSKME